MLRFGLSLAKACNLLKIKTGPSLQFRVDGLAKPPKLGPRRQSGTELNDRRLPQSAPRWKRQLSKLLAWSVRAGGDAVRPARAGARAIPAAPLAATSPVAGCRRSPEGRHARAARRDRTRRRRTALPRVTDTTPAAGWHRHVPPSVSGARPAAATTAHEHGDGRCARLSRTQNIIYGKQWRGKAVGSEIRRFAHRPCFSHAAIRAFLS